MNPYEILQIPTTATDDQVKAAYRHMARQFHPDVTGEVPDPQAQAHMQAINEAYDSIIRERQAKRGYTGTSSSAETSTASTASAEPSTSAHTAPRYSDIRRMINGGRLADAEMLLDGIAHSERDAEWFYLKGTVLYRKGWLEDAYRHFEQACVMDAANPEYRTAYNQMQHQRQRGSYRHSGYQNRGCGVSPCDCCAGLMCADCLCNSRCC